MKKKKLSSIVILVALIAFTGVKTYSQRGYGNGSGNGNYCYNISDLTDSQKEKISKLRVTHQKEMLDLSNNLNEKQNLLQSLELAENPDKNEINKNIDEIGKLKSTQIKSRSEFQLEVKKLLTDNQKKEFESNNSNNNGLCKKNGRGNSYGFGNGHRHGKVNRNCCRN